MARGVALTGATGFLGGHVLAALGRHGLKVQALTRRPQTARAGVAWIAGGLEAAPLDALCTGCDAIIHMAGATTAPDRAAFARTNIDGTEAVLAAAQRAGVARVVHVSSLSARLPDLSDYGWSKAQSEALVAASGARWTIVRPPAIFGPGDQDFLPLFQMAARGVGIVPGNGALSVIYAPDLAELLVALIASGDGLGRIFEPDDGRDNWTHRSFAAAIGAAVGRAPLIVSTPKVVARAGAWIDGRLRGSGARLTPDRVRYFYHADWRVDPLHRPPEALWQAATPTPEALAATAQAYRLTGALPSSRRNLLA